MLHQELSSLQLKGAIKELPQSDLKQGFFSRYFLVPKKEAVYDPFWTCVAWTSPFTKGSSRCWLWRLLCPRFKWESGLSLLTWRMPIFTFRSSGGTGSSFGLPLEERLTSTRFFPLALAPRTFTKCVDAALAPLRLQGICVLNYLDDWLILAHSRELVNYHRDIVFCHIRALGLRTNTKKECSHPFSKNCVFGGLLGFRSNSGPSGSCPDLQFQRMFGPLQARPSCLCEHLSQAPRPYGRSLPCATSRIAPHETISLVDKIVEDPLHRTSHSPNQGVAQLLSHPLNMAKPHFSLEGSQNGCDSLSPHGYDGCIIDWLGRGLQRQTSARCFDRRVPLLVHKLSGAQSRLPGTDSLSPPSQRVLCDSQDGQHCGGIPHKSPRGFTVMHPE